MVDIQVLIVNDEFLIMNSLKRLFDGFVGCKVITSTHPQTALKMPEVVEGRVDLVIAAQGLPDIEGISFLRSVYKTCPHASRILLYDTKDKEKMQASVAKDEIVCVEKPWDNAEFIERIKIGIEKVRVAKAVEKKNKELLEWNRTLEKRVKSRVAAIKNLLDNANEGFLTVYDNFKIGEEYSLECDVIFEKNISGLRFSELIYPTNEDSKVFIEDLLKKLFHETSLVRTEAYLSLLPEQLTMNEKNLHVQYKVVDDPDFEERKALMVIITDITDRIRLENTIDNERRRWKMALGAILDTRGFRDTIDAYKNYINTEVFVQIERSVSSERAISGIMPVVHTYKGILSLKELQKSVQALHQLEDRFVQIKNQKIALSDLKSLFQEQGLQKALDQDLQEIREVVGERSFMNAEMVEVRKDILGQLKKMIELLPGGPIQTSLMENYQKLHYVSIYQMLKAYETYVEKIASKMGKMIEPLKIEGGKVYVDPMVYGDLMKSFVHILRNCVHHGIEHPDERVEKNKEPNGQIRFRVHHTKDTVTFIIGDDGGGINVKRVKKVALEKQICTKEKIDTMDEQQIIKLILAPDFSTQANVDLISGRGEGLHAVQQAVDRLNGSIEMNTQIDKGTIFKIKVPLHG